MSDVKYAFVIMDNDYPDSVWSTLEAAKEERDRLREADFDAADKANQLYYRKNGMYYRHYYKIWPFPLDVNRVDQAKISIPQELYNVMIGL